MNSDAPPWLDQGGAFFAKLRFGSTSSMFVFFSRRLGCVGSLLISAIMTILLLYLLGWL
jgi:hypothetical protein